MKKTIRVKTGYDGVGCHTGGDFLQVRGEGMFKPLVLKAKASG
jgi:hypothetical protein